MSEIEYTVVDRFLRYVQIDTQANERSETCPSTARQKELGQLLAAELTELGLDAEMDEHGYVYGLLPSNSPKQVPTIALLAHQDTSPEAPGAGVKPIVHDYQGGDIALPGAEGVVIDAAGNPHLADLVGTQVITSDGSTLLGADDKAGIAEILDAVAHLVRNPDIPHGPVRIVFTVDEEIGRGVDKLDMDRVGAVAAYTFDGTIAGQMEIETFSADLAVVTCLGTNVHPGFAKDKMTNAVKLAASFVDKLPRGRFSPETTEEMEGYVHPYVIEGGVDRVVIKVLLRSFATADLAEQAAYLRDLAAQVVAEYPTGKVEVEVKAQYRNMRDELEKHPDVVEVAKEAIRRTGLTPVAASIRGGTDGSRLTDMGLPTPNIFAGGLNFHSVREFVGVETMKRAVDVGVELIKLWEERA